MTKVPVGLSTIAGLVGSGATVVLLFIAELADATRPLGVPPAVWVVVAAALTALVIFGRMGQAIALAIRRPPDPPTRWSP